MEEVNTTELRNFLLKHMKEKRNTNVKRKKPITKDIK